MKKITLKKMTLLNFKGIRERTINFSHVTDIYGMNGTGKTTIFDAFLWLFFGKDSTGRKDFEVKTLDSNNQAFHKMSHEVSITIEVDGDTVDIRRTYKENWPTKKGTAVETFTGHTTNFYWNEVPCNETEFKKKVAMILDEDQFKLITNTGYFASLKWQDRRNVLESIAGTITNEMVFDSIATPQNDFTALINALNAGKSLDEYRREISNKKKLIKDEKELLPSRIDEAKRSLPEFVNYSEIEKNLTNAQYDLNMIDSQIEDSNLQFQSLQDEKRNLLTEINELRNNCSTIEFNIKNSILEEQRKRSQQLHDEQRKLSDLQDKQRRISSQISEVKNLISSLQGKRESILKQWHEVNDKKLQLLDHDFRCPTCHREFESGTVAEKKDQLTQNFNKDKSEKLAEITRSGQSVKADLDAAEEKLKILTDELSLLQPEIDHQTTLIKDMEQRNAQLLQSEQNELKEKINSHHGYQQLLKDIAAKQELADAPINTDSNAVMLKEHRKEKIALIDNLKTQLAGKGQREKIEARIQELQNSESAMAQQLATFEGIEFSIATFEKAKMDMLENRVNGMFSIVKFKLFEDQINGGQVPCCETLINGVPYSDANTASKIQAGIDIINTLCKFYGISAPIFIDNRESVVNIPASDSQIINLIVSASDTTLRIQQAA